MATTHVIFKTGKMVSKHIDSYLKNVVNSSADMDNGNFVALYGLVSGEVDTWSASTPTSITAQEVFVIDEPVRNLIGGQYAIDVADPREFYVPSGRVARARKILHGDTCYITSAGFVSTPTVGQYAIPTNGSMKLTPAATATGALVIFKVISAETFFVGTTSVSGYRLECVSAV